MQSPFSLFSAKEGIDRNTYTYIFLWLSIASDFLCLSQEVTCDAPSRCMVHALDLTTRMIRFFCTGFRTKPSFAT